MRYFLVFAVVRRTPGVARHEVFKMEYNIFPSQEQIKEKWCSVEGGIHETIPVDITGITEVDKGAWKAF